MKEAYRPSIVTDDRYEVYLAEKVEEIRKICIREQIPCFMAFGLRTSGQTGEEYQLKLATCTKDDIKDIPKDTDTPDIHTVAILPEVLPVAFDDRRFSDYVNITNHFRAIPASEYAAMTPEDIVVAPMEEDFKNSMSDIANQDVKEMQKAVINFE